MVETLAIERIGFTRFTNARLLTFFSRVLLLILKYTEEKLGVIDGMSKFQARLKDLEDIVQISKKAHQKWKLKELDTKRCDLHRYVVGTMDIELLSHNEARHDAAKWLLTAMDKYRKVPRMALDAKTANIKGFVLDLKKEENAKLATTLSLTESITELEKSNQEYEKIWLERNEARTMIKKLRTDECKKDLVIMFHWITNTIYAKYILEQTEEAKSFISELNTIIQATKTAQKQSIAQKKKNEKDKTTDPKKEETSTDTTETKKEDPGKVDETNKESTLEEPKISEGKTETIITDNTKEINNP